MAFARWSWFYGSRCPARRSRRCRPRPAGCRLGLENLEVRTVPSVQPLTGAATGHLITPAGGGTDATASLAAGQFSFPSGGGGYQTVAIAPVATGGRIGVDVIPPPVTSPGPVNDPHGGRPHQDTSPPPIPSTGAGGGTTDVIAPVLLPAPNPLPPVTGVTNPVGGYPVGPPVAGKGRDTVPDTVPPDISSSGSGNVGEAITQDPVLVPVPDAGEPSGAVGLFSVPVLALGGPLASGDAGESFAAPVFAGAAAPVSPAAAPAEGAGLPGGAPVVESAAPVPPSRGAAVVNGSAVASPGPGAASGAGLPDAGTARGLANPSPKAAAAAASSSPAPDTAPDRDGVWFPPAADAGPGFTADARPAASPAGWCEVGAGPALAAEVGATWDRLAGGLDAGAELVTPATRLAALDAALDPATGPGYVLAGLLVAAACWGPGWAEKSAGPREDRRRTPRLGFAGT